MDTKSKGGSVDVLIGVGKPVGKPGSKPPAAPMGADDGSDIGGDSGALAGTALIKAIKSGDGSAVFEAMKTIAREVNDNDSDDSATPVDDGEESK